MYIKLETVDVMIKLEQVALVSQVYESNSPKRIYFNIILDSGYEILVGCGEGLPYVIEYTPENISMVKKDRELVIESFKYINGKFELK